MAVESVNRPDSAEEPSPIPIADLRDVPLGELGRDPDALRMVSRSMEAAEGASRVRVAMFQSAI
jgi:FXSXX-COOH protein